MLFVLNEAPDSCFGPCCSSLWERRSLLITLECGFSRKCEENVPTSPSYNYSFLPELHLQFLTKDQETYAVMKAFSVLFDFLELFKHFHSKEL